MTQTFTTIDAYIQSVPRKDQDVLTLLRATIRRAAPQATETISYRMPTFRLNGKNLVHFAWFPHHIGFYPTPSAIAAFLAELAHYRHSKGAVQFPKDQPLPVSLIEKMVQFRVHEMETQP